MANKMLKNIFLLFIPLFILGCGNIDNVEVGEIENIQFNGIKGSKIFLEIDVPVKNPSIYKLEIKEIKSDVIINNLKIGHISDIEKVVIKPYSDEVKHVKLEIQVTNLLGGLFSVANTFRKNKISYEISGYIKIKTLLFTKTIDIQKEDIVETRKNNK
ncbi:MAG: LEA type 2 family protein [bacterium]